MAGLTKIVIILVVGAILGGVALAASFFGTMRENTIPDA